MGWAPQDDLQFTELTPLTIDGEGQEPRRNHLLKLAEQVGLKPHGAAHIVELVRRAIADFGKLAAKQ